MSENSGKKCFFNINIQINIDWLLVITASMMLILDAVLLNIGKFSGTDFIAFMVAVIFFCFAAKVFPQISTMSIAGNSITLREKIVEADKLTKQLRALRDMFISQALNSLARSSGNNYEVIKRFNDFVFLYNELVLDNDIINTHKAKIEETINFIEEGCLRFVKFFFTEGDERLTIDKVSTIFNKFDGTENLPVGHQSGYEFSRIILTLNHMEKQLNSEARSAVEVSPYVISMSYASAAR